MVNTKRAVVEGTDVERFYRPALDCLVKSGVPFMVAGAYALRSYTGIVRDTKDFDVFCTPGDFPKLLETLGDCGYETQVTDANWIAKAFKDDHCVDLIFGSGNDLVRVDETWLQHAPDAEMLGQSVKLIPVEEMIWSKAYIEDRFRYDGADVAHLILKKGEDLDWRRLLMRMDRDWELLYTHLLNFRFIYPSERDCVPGWLLDELASRLQNHRQLPAPQDRVCRGSLLSRTEYRVDVDEWGFKEQ